MELTSLAVEPNVPWAELPLQDQDLNGLTPEFQQIVRQFNHDGYAVLDTNLALSLIDETVHTLKDYFYDAQGKLKGDFTYKAGDGVRVQDAWKFNPLVRQIAACEKIYQVLRLLYRRDPIPFQTLNFPVGTQQKTHSDTIHFNSLPHRYMCGVWVALEDTDANNGPLHYYPGSHKLPVFELSDLGLPTQSSGYWWGEYGERYKAYEKFVEHYMESVGIQRQELYIRKGQALIWASNLYHGGSPVLDPSRTRWSQVTHYFFSNCIYYHPQGSDLHMGNIMERKIIDVTTGQRVHSSFNGDKATFSKVYEAKLLARRFKSFVDKKLQPKR